MIEYGLNKEGCTINGTQRKNQFNASGPERSYCLIVTMPLLNIIFPDLFGYLELVFLILLYYFFASYLWHVDQCANAFL